MRNASGSTPAGRHEGQRPVDVARHHLVLLVGGGRRDEALVPRVHLAQVGETALGERTDEVQRRGRGAVDLEQPLGVVPAGLRRELQAVDRVTAVRRERHAVAGLGVGAARLGELAGDPADLHHRHLRAVGQDHGHLQQGLDLVPDRVRGGVDEGLGAVATLEQEGLAARDGAEALLEGVALAGEDQRREHLELGDDGVQRGTVRPVGGARGGCCAASPSPHQPTVAALREGVLAHLTDAGTEKR